MRPVSHRVEDRSPAIVVHDWGGDGPPVLLSHATGFHGLVWAPVAERLVAAGRRVWSWDFRGHGDSEPSPAGYDWEGFADDALRVVTHLGLAGEPSLLAAGHSKGAASLLRGEAREPGTYARLWCFEPIIFPSEETLPPTRRTCSPRARDGGGASGTRSSRPWPRTGRSPRSTCCTPTRCAPTWSTGSGSAPTGASS
ncbi:MAG: alpha/beta hydrolase [Acidimicrobiia bacterium]|nr:alpha/beta hydrolase [Acidimicrobiia bacterium]